MHLLHLPVRDLAQAERSNYRETCMPRPIVAKIDTRALAHNLAVAKRLAGHARVWAVIKANAYGHGLLRAAQAFAAADGLAMLDIEEAVQLRHAGETRPLLLLEGFFDSADLMQCAAHQLTPVIHCTEQLALLSTSTLQAPLDVYLKINTGMHRLGFSVDTVPEVWRALCGLKQVRHITLMTHFANADGDQAPSVTAQRQQFERATQGLQTATGQPVMRSLANSAALVHFPQTHADWVRPGILLYGCSPFAFARTDQRADVLGLRPAMTLQSTLIAVQSLAKGQSVGYGGSFTAPHAMRIGIVACGYADGYPRHAPTGTPVLVHQMRTHLVGRVSMDMLAIDLTNMPNAGVAAPVTLWGAGLSADEVASHAGTIAYEMLCALAPRVPVQVM